MLYRAMDSVKFSVWVNLVGGLIYYSFIIKYSI